MSSAAHAQPGAAPLRHGRLLTGAQGFFEGIIFVLGSFLLTFVQEAWRATGRFIISVVGLLLSLVNRSAFESWKREQKLRFTAGSPKTSPDSLTKFPASPPSELKRASSLLISPELIRKAKKDKEAKEVNEKGKEKKEKKRSAIEGQEHEAKPPGDLTEAQRVHLLHASLEEEPLVPSSSSTFSSLLTPSSSPPPPSPSIEKSPIKTLRRRSAPLKRSMSLPPSALPPLAPSLSPSHDEEDAAPSPAPAFKPSLTVSRHTPPRASDYSPSELEWDDDADILYHVDELDPGARDKLFAHEKVTTGFLEDLRLTLLLAIFSLRTWSIDQSARFFNFLSTFSIRGILRTLFSLDFWLSPVWWFFSLLWFFASAAFSLIRSPTLMPKKVTSFTSRIIQQQFENIDKRDRKTMLQTKGYPFDEYTVVTSDGYVLTLERLPRPNARKAVYFQHGVFDSAYAWFAETQHVGMNIAFRAYDLGYDVWAGTLRGCAPKKEHVNPSISAKNYWNFTVNEHAFNDLPAFINKIKEIKAAELSKLDPDAPATSKLTMVAHSMGAMSALMYATWWRMRGLNHHLDAMILLSPAGIHKTAPRICRVTGPVISASLNVLPIYSFRFPSDFVRILVTKFMEDVSESYSTRKLVSHFANKVLGGDPNKEHSYFSAHLLTYNVFSGTSAGIFKHFWQIYCRQKFESYDYGPEKNLQFYGTTDPIDFLKNYKSLDIPVYFVLGRRDTLIEPVSVLGHYEALRAVKPHLAFLKSFASMGHIDFTVGENSEVSNFIFDVLKTREEQQQPVKI